VCAHSGQLLKAICRILEVKQESRQNILPVFTSEPREDRRAGLGGARRD
jgi:hypothetical protein